MKEFEVKISESLYDNSLIFLKDAVEKLISDSNIDNAILVNKDVLLACTSIQTSLELAIKSLIIGKIDLRHILNNKQKNFSDEEILKMFSDNRIKTADFDVLKNCVKSKDLVSTLKKNDFKIIDDFQLYRNKLLHFVYNFSEGEGHTLEYNLFYYILHVVFKIFSEIRNEDIPSIFLEKLLGLELMQRLTNYEPYRSAMEKLVHEYSDKVYNCVFCNARTLSIEDEYCYCCNADYEVHSLTHCSFCKEEHSMLYDNLNLAEDCLARGLCLNCDEDGIIFECPKCGEAYNIEMESGCTLEKCLNM